MNRRMFLGLAPVAVIGMTGCKTIETSPQTLDDAVVILRTTSRTAALIVLQDKPTAKPWFDLAITMIDVILNGTDYTPGRLTEVLKTLPAKELNDARTRAAVSAVEDLYTLYFSRYVQGKLGAGTAAVRLINAVKDGFKQGIAPA